MLRTKQKALLGAAIAMIFLASFVTGCSHTKKIDADLARAIKSDNSTLLKVLIKRGADLTTGEVDNRDPEASTGRLWKSPLMLAAASGALKSAKVLLDHGVKIDQPNWWKETALHFAIENKKVKMVGLLIKRGADVNKTADHGITPLLLACHDMTRKANLEIAKLLLKSGASPNAEGTIRKHYADLSYEYPEDFSPLHYVTMKGYDDYAEIIPLLLKAGAVIDDGNSWGVTPLMYAASSGQKKIISILLANKASVNAQDKDGKTPLMHLVADSLSTSRNQNHRLVSINLLLKRGALVNERDNKQQSATQIASLKKLKLIEAFLIRKGGKL